MATTSNTEALPELPSKDSEIKLVPGATFPITSNSEPFPSEYSGQCPPYEQNTCIPLESDRFKVRIGPDYAKRGEKAPSQRSLFEIVGCDMFKVEQRSFHLAPRFDIDSLLQGDTVKEICGVPKIFVFVTLLPDRTVEDGSGFIFIQFYKMRAWTEEKLRVLEKHMDENPEGVVDSQEIPASIRLFQRFVNAPKGDDLEKRFKIIPKILNITEASMPWALQMALSTQYNGKPFLSRPQHQMFKAESYYEVDMDVFDFNWLSKWSLNTMLANWKKGEDMVRNMVLDFAVLVEGQTDDELPEQIIGAFQMQGILLNTAITASFE